MAQGSPGAGRRTGSLLVALVTLVLPLLGIGTLAVQAPAREAAAVARPTALPLVDDAPPLPVRIMALPTPTVPPPQPKPTVNPLPRWTREDRMTFLLLGMDRRPEDVVFRTDTVILASLDLRSKRAALISVPRDLLVSIPGYGSERINSAYAVGELTKRPGGGLTLLRETVERNFGVRIHHHAIVDFNCFRGTVDALGGVRIDVPSRIEDRAYPTDDYGTKVVIFEPGPQTLNGERALEYARTRHGDSDFGRMRRQQQLLSALKEQALQVQSLGALPQAIQACSGLSSDLSILDLVALGVSARDINTSNVTYRVIDEQMTTRHITPTGADVLLPRWEAIRAMVRATMLGGVTSVVSTSE